MDLSQVSVEGTFGLAMLIIYLICAMYFPLLKFFFYFVLPPIIFTEGYTMRRKRFFKNIYYISLFGILATLINFVVNAAGASVISDYIGIHDQHGNPISLTGQEVLQIGAILSASDAVAACSMIEEEDAPRINSILLGAGVMNDAVSIILFHSAENLSGVDKIQAEDVALFVAQFLYDVLASIGIGVCFGVISAVMTKYVRKFEDFPSYETALLLFLAYIGYFLTEMFGFSGVISLLCSGIVMGHYTWYNLSVEARIVSRASFTIMGELLVAYIFVYVGFSTYSCLDETISYDFIGMMLIVLVFGRLLGVVVLPGLMKFAFKRFNLGWKDLTAIWFAGCIRGAIAFALTLTISGIDDDHPDPDKELIKTTVLGVVLFTTIVFGAMMPILKKLVLTFSTFLYRKRAYLLFNASSSL